MDSTTEALTPKITPFGLVLAIIAGAIAAAGIGFAYHLVANRLGFDYIIVIAISLGLIVGFAVGLAARIGGLRSTGIVILIAFVFGVGAYAARYFFEFNDVVDIIVQETIANAPAAADVPVELVRTFVLEDLAEAYPPGGFSGYLQFVANEGFSISSRGSDTSNTPIQGGLAWGLLGIEALAAGVAAAATARRSHTWSGPAVSTVTDTTAGLPDSSDQ